MAWNEPGKGNGDKDPWGNRNNQNGPPDLDEMLKKLWKQVAPLLQSEHNAKGRLRTVSETQALARKEALLEEIEQLEVRACCFGEHVVMADWLVGWFEE